MFEALKTFIEENIQLIENGEFAELYAMNVDYPKLTQVLLKAGIDPLEKLNYIPANYLSQSDIFEFSVPSHIKEIHSGAFWACENLNKVTLPEGLIKIEDSAFCECHNLQHINLPATLEYIQEDVFAETNLHHVVIPELVATIPRHCFESCKQLETVKLGTYTQKVTSRAFAECDQLRYVQLNQGLDTIGSYAFSECAALTEIYIPETVQQIGTNAFYKSPTKIICTEDSAAHAYALQNMLDFELI